MLNLPLIYVDQTNSAYCMYHYKIPHESKAQTVVKLRYIFQQSCHLSMINHLSKLCKFVVFDNQFSLILILFWQFYCIFWVSLKVPPAHRWPTSSLINPHGPGCKILNQILKWSPNCKLHMSYWPRGVDFTASRRVEPSMTPVFCISFSMKIILVFLSVILNDIIFRFSLGYCLLHVFICYGNDSLTRTWNLYSPNHNCHYKKTKTDH